MATNVKSVTVTLRSGVSDATLPDNRKMRSGVSYAISLEDWAKISRSVRDTVIDEPTFNTSAFVIPEWDGTNYAKDLTNGTYHNTATLPPIYSGSSKTVPLGTVKQGFGGAVFKLVKLVDAVASTTTKNVATWSDKDTNEVTVDISNSDAGEFAGVLIAATTAGRYGWIQVEGIVDSAAADAAVSAGEPIYVDPSTDGVFNSGRTNATQVITLTGFSGTDSFTITFDGQTTASIVRGTNASAADVKTALVALSNIASADISVTGTTDAGPYTVTFDEGGAYEGLAVELFTITGTGCTGVSVTTADGGEVTGTTVGTALTASSATKADVELRSGLFANRHRKTANLFLSKQG